jgi:predicted DCC family thiol-disulfide oxidoreductase YuxK
LRDALESHGYVLLYDGQCGLCHRVVQFVLRHDRTGAMRFARLQGSVGQSVVAAIPELAGIDSLVLLHRDGAWVRSTAALELARYLGGTFHLMLVGYFLPRRLRDWLYDRVARNRYRVFGTMGACPVPDAETRARFLD